MDKENKTESYTSDSKKSSSKIIKRDVTLNIGGVDYTLKKGESLPDDIDKSFYTSLKNEEVI